MCNIYSDKPDPAATYISSHHNIEYQISQPNNLVNMEVECVMEQWKNLNNPDISFLKDVLRITMKHRRESRPFFVGLCYYCKELGGPEGILLRCSGCQLVAYCSRDCQKEDRSGHKIMCKEFPVVNGKNALYTTGPFVDHIARWKSQVSDTGC